MATYAAYRHIELDNVGYGKKRVLKPPGGGSSDIFGGAAKETSPRRAKSYTQSQINSAFFGEAGGGGGGGGGGSTGSNSSLNSAPETPRAKPGNDSYKRLFGPPDAVPTTPSSKNHMRSNLPFCGDNTAEIVISPAKSIASSEGSASTENLANGNTNGNVGSVSEVSDGNPVTGIGYASDQVDKSSSTMNGNSSDKSSTDSSLSAPSVGSNNRPRNRVPPGGYSSGLW